MNRREAILTGIAATALPNVARAREPFEHLAR